jgi:hypothetical protein
LIAEKAVGRWGPALDIQRSNSFVPKASILKVPSRRPSSGLVKGRNLLVDAHGYGLPVEQFAEHASEGWGWFNEVLIHGLK